ncbi:hypothetical protein JCM9279_000021 [Rhodotorula babjevae]
MAKRALVTIGCDVDSCAGWLGSYHGEDSPNDMSRGVFAAEVGVPRLLKLFRKYKIQASFFIPGHTLDSFPDEMAEIVKDGHEVGLHGYTHECPSAMTLSQQKEILDHTYEQLTKLAGKPPVGSVAPWWESSKEGIALLQEKGILYDHSSQAHDCMPFYTRTEDTWTKIDYSAKSAKSWMKPLVKGELTSLVTIPANWYLDDLPPHMFIKGAANSHGYVDARTTLHLWKQHFTYFYREHDWHVFPLTIHPDVSGRPHILLMLEEFIEWLQTHDGVEFVTMEAVAKEFRQKYPYPGEQAKYVAKESKDVEQ